MLVATKKSLKVGKQVNTEYVNNAIRNYKQERWVNNSKHIGKEDALSLWFSLQEIKEFLEQSESYGADGLRLYFGANDVNHENEVLAARQTVILVATKQKETEAGTTNKDVYIQTEKGSSILAYNGSIPCPPSCGPRGDGRGVSTMVNGNEGLVIA